MVNNLVVYSLSCQPSRWIYQPCKASLSGLQLLLIRLARTRIRLAFQRISCISDWQWQLRCKVIATPHSVPLGQRTRRQARLAFAEPQPAVAVASSLQRQRYEKIGGRAKFQSKIRHFWGVFFVLILQENQKGYKLARIGHLDFWTLDVLVIFIFTNGKNTYI